MIFPVSAAEAYECETDIPGNGLFVHHPDYVLPHGQPAVPEGQITVWIIPRSEDSTNTMLLKVQGRAFATDHSWRSDPAHALKYIEVLLRLMGYQEVRLQDL